MDGKTAANFKLFVEYDNCKSVLTRLVLSAKYKVSYTPGQLFTERQSLMLPDLSVQRKTPNGPKLKSLTYCAICYIMYIS